MLVSRIAPLSRALAIAAVTTALIAPSTTTVSPADAQPVDRRAATNPTGTAAGSAANGTGYLRLSLSTLADGRVRVGWTNPAPTRRTKKFIIKVGANRLLDSQVRTYHVKRTKRSVIVPTAYGATPYSGNFSFVKVYRVLRDGRAGSSPTKWIQASLRASCTASPAHRVTVGTFNVRTWSLDRGTDATNHGWGVRGGRVVAEILRSGARVIAVQEASGQANVAFGNVRQHRWILDRLNDTDASRGHRWADAVGDDAYRRGGGLVGTRILYDAGRYEHLASGLVRIRDAAAPGDSLLPWARLQAVGQTQPAFTFASAHLGTGDDRTAYDVRGRQIATIISVLKAKSAAGGQVILGGDLNSTVNSKPSNNAQVALLRAGFYDAFATTTIVNSRFGTTNNFHFPIRATPYRRDYLMTLGPVKGSCSYVNRAYQSDSQLASDHFMQVATLPLATD